MNFRIPETAGISWRTQLLLRMEAAQQRQVKGKYIGRVPASEWEWSLYDTMIKLLFRNKMGSSLDLLVSPCWIKLPSTWGLASGLQLHGGVGGDSTLLAYLLLPQYWSGRAPCSIIPPSLLLTPHRNRHFLQTHKYFKLFNLFTFVAWRLYNSGNVAVHNLLCFCHRRKLRRKVQ
jgi:hypothetical protein